MRLLLGQNLSRRILESVDDLFPNSLHVSGAGLDRMSDAAIWEFARGRGLAIVSKDTDFLQMSMALGHPPKVEYLALGNCSTTTVIEVLRSSVDDLRDFAEDDDASFLALGQA